MLRSFLLTQALVPGVLILVAIYFTYAAVQGNFGLFQRIEAEAELQMREADLSDLEAEVRHMENLTRRLSDQYLDLDLLDERVRNVLGYARPSEVVLP